MLSGILGNERLNLSPELIDFTVYSTTKTLCFQLLRNQMYLQVPIAQLLVKIYERRRVEINQRLEDNSDESLKKGSFNAFR